MKKQDLVFSKYAWMAVAAAVALIIIAAVAASSASLGAQIPRKDNNNSNSSPSATAAGAAGTGGESTPAATVSSSAATGSGGEKSVSSAGQRAGVYFPLFAHPGPLWDNMLVYRQAHPSLPWVAVVDPLHGPGKQYDATYARSIKKLQEADVTVLGYVSTRWAQKPPDAVKDDISKYKEWYGVDGIMLDEMISNPGFEGLYSNYTSYAKSLGMGLVIGNVGTNVSPSYAGTVDAISTVEGDRTPPLSWLKGWQLNYDRSNFVYIAYSQSWIDPKYVAESTKYVGMLYITDDTMPFPYDDFPAYFDEVLAVLDPQGNNSLRNLSVRASDLLGNASLEGMPVKVELLSSTSSPSSSPVPATGSAPTTTAAAAGEDSGITPFVHIGAVNSTYAVTALSNNSTYVFDHWDDGSRNPSRVVTLDSSKVLRAYYRTPSTPDLHSSVLVNALTTQGGQLSMWMNIASQNNGKDSGSGLTPVVVRAPSAAGGGGMNYAITASDHQHLVFDHWEDGSRNRTRTVSLSSPPPPPPLQQQGSNGDNNNLYLTAYYRFQEDPSLLDLTVDAYTLDGTEVRGLWSVITPVAAAGSNGGGGGGGGGAAGGYTPFTQVARSNMTYSIQAQDSGIYKFDHWENGSTNRTRTVVMPGSDATFSAYYSTPPAELRINFASLSGKGGPPTGLYAVVAPMSASAGGNDDGNNNTVGISRNDGGSSGSAAAAVPERVMTDSGPATFLGRLGSVYTIKVYDSADYVFDHWEDGSTAKVRHVMLSPALSSQSSTSADGGAGTTGGILEEQVTAYYRERGGGGAEEASVAKSQPPSP
jgi:hypothetical protein